MPVKSLTDQSTQAMSVSPKTGAAGSVGCAMKDKPACIPNRFNQRSWIIGKGRNFVVSAKDQQMVLLRIPILIVHFLSNQHQHPAAPVPDIALNAVDKHVVVGDDDGIQAAAEGGRGNIVMTAAAIRVAGVHVQVYDDFMHENRRLEWCFFGPALDVPRDCGRFVLEFPPGSWVHQLLKGLCSEHRLG